MSPRRLVTALVVTCLLGACGMKGPLYLPANPPEAPAAKADAPTTPPEDNRK